MGHNRISAGRESALENDLPDEATAHEVLERLPSCGEGIGCRNDRVDVVVLDETDQVPHLVERPHRHPYDAEPSPEDPPEVRRRIRTRGRSGHDDRTSRPERAEARSPRGLTHALENHVELSAGVGLGIVAREDHVICSCRKEPGSNLGTPDLRDHRCAEGLPELERGDAYSSCGTRDEDPGRPVDLRLLEHRPCGQPRGRQAGRLDRREVPG
ncbi:MAG: hypothetical protein DYH08_17510 [Actinobacteria bacterium ATB1]|nr:hypothetical protein [Actinobacteria bacterium ATB1]